MVLKIDTIDDTSGADHPQNGAPVLPGECDQPCEPGQDRFRPRDVKSSFRHDEIMLRIDVPEDRYWHYGERFYDPSGVLVNLRSDRSNEMGLPRRAWTHRQFNALRGGSVWGTRRPTPLLPGGGGSSNGHPHKRSILSAGCKRYAAMTRFTRQYEEPHAGHRFPMIDRIQNRADQNVCVSLLRLEKRPLRYQ